MKPSYLWYLSCQAYKYKMTLIARILKAANYLLFHTILPYEAEFERDIQLVHRALGVVIHPNVKIGYNVRIFHNVTIAVQASIGSSHKIVIGNQVIIGTGVTIVGRVNQTLTIGDGAKIGANAVVTRDVLPHQTVVGIPARPIKRQKLSVQTK